jgi:PAS domain S-box-containing protein/putative nucleotidyltransferase with HDIG domain
MDAEPTLRVLLVEDNPGDVRLIETFLDGEFETSAAPRLSVAVELLAQESVDAVLLDLGLPDSQGLDTLERLRAASQAVPVIVLTGLEDTETALAAIQRGAQDYLTKGGFDEQLLRRAIRYAVERQRAEASLRRSRERYRSLFEQMNEAILVVQDEVVRAANRKSEELVGWTVSELAGRSFFELVHPDDRDLVVERHRCRMRGEDPPRQYEFRVMTREGGSRWVEVSADRIEWENKAASLSLLTDVTERRKATERSTQLLKRQTAINELAFALGSTSDTPQVCRILYDHVRRLMTADEFIVSHIDAESQQLRPTFVVAEGAERDVSQLPAIPDESEGQKAERHVLQTGRATYISDWLANGEATDRAPAGEQAGSVRSALLAPMRCEDDVIGVLEVRSRTPEGYGDEDLDLIAGLANVAAIAIRNSQRAEEAQSHAAQVQAAFEALIRTISALAGTRDPYTAGHQQRVAKLAVAISEELGLDDATVECVRVSSLVHDIGKLSIPAEILSKPSKLTDAEFRIIRSHADSAFRILSDVEFPWPIAQTVHQHHERLDGTGYPLALKGEEIRPEARIIAVADVVEAMASHRPYRPARGLDSALEEIRAHRSTWFDPRVVDACVTLFRDRGFQLSEEDAE